MEDKTALKLLEELYPQLTDEQNIPEVFKTLSEIAVRYHGIKTAQSLALFLSPLLELYQDSLEGVLEEKSWRLLHLLLSLEVPVVKCFEILGQEVLSKEFSDFFFNIHASIISGEIVSESFASTSLFSQDFLEELKGNEAEGDLQSFFEKENVEKFKNNFSLRRIINKKDKE
ncbi:MAG: hypothetical protein K9K67_05965 [Bacteriovoracaceae bacterium]|nr:hypothetical protein [Bacteriovoracaceae bacterium]